MPADFCCSVRFEQSDASRCPVLHASEDRTHSSGSSLPEVQCSSRSGLVTAPISEHGDAGPAPHLFAVRELAELGMVAFQKNPLRPETWVSLLEADRNGGRRQGKRWSV